MLGPTAGSIRLLGAVVILLGAACAPQSPTVPATDTPQTEPSNSTSAPTDEALVEAPALVAIRMFDESNGWAVSDSAVLRTVDGGVAWLDVSPPQVHSLGYAAVTEFIDSLHGWVLAAAPENPLNGILYRTADGGATWDQSPVPFGRGAMEFLDSKRGWMMADLGAGAGSMAVAIFQTEDSGATWTRNYTNDPTQPDAATTLPLGGLKNGITPMTLEQAWIGGIVYQPGRIYLYETTDGGRTWAPSPVKAPREYESAELQTPGPLFATPQVGYLPVHLSSQYGVLLAVYISRDGGTSWKLTPQYIPQGGTLDFVSPEVGFTWNGHSFYMTEDAAQTWVAVTPDIDFTDSFAGMDFVTPQVGFVVSDQGPRGRHLYVSRDSGATWNIVTR